MPIAMRNQGSQSKSLESIGQEVMKCTDQYLWLIFKKKKEKSDLKLNKVPFI